MSKCNIADIHNYLFYLRKYKNSWVKNSTELEQQKHKADCDEIFEKIKNQNSIDTKKHDTQLTNEEINLLEFQILRMMNIKNEWNSTETLPTVSLKNNYNNSEKDANIDNDNDDSNNKKTKN